MTDFDELHERRMHLIVVRRDGTGFRHLHPEMDAEGTWTVPVELAEAGVYRVFADFSVGGRAAHARQRSSSSAASSRRGRSRRRPPLESTSGYEVTPATRARRTPVRTASLGFAVSKDGKAVERPRSPISAPRGHLVALREGDLAFLHVHPEPGDAAQRTASVEFAATFPTAGRYRLYLQFRHEGAVQTAEFTVAVPR